MIHGKVYNLHNLKFSPVEFDCKTIFGVMKIIAQLQASYKWQLIAIEVPNSGPQYDYLFAMKDNLKNAVVGIIYTKDTTPPNFNLQAGVA